MEEKEIKFSLEDIRKMLEKFKGAILYPVTIENIMDDFKEDFLKDLKVGAVIQSVKTDSTTINDAEISTEITELMEGSKSLQHLWKERRQNQK